MMKSPFLQGFAFWLVVTVNLVLTFFMGYMLTALPLIGFTISGLLIIILSFLVNFTIVFYFKRSIEIPKDRRLFVVVLIYLNALFALAMGLSIPLMEDPSKDNLGFVMIPLLIILNIIIVDRFFFYLKIGKSIEETTDLNITSLKSQKRKWPIIEFEGKKYQFSIRSLLMLAIGAPLLAWLVYLFFDNQANFWLHEIVVKQTELFLNLFFNMGASVQYYPSGIYHWRFIIPGTPTPIYFETFCTGVQAICVFVGIIIFTPHSKDPKTKKDIVWRKTKSLIVSSILFYAVNIIRMLIQLDLYYNGYKWEDIHYSISAASSFIAAIIVLLLHKWIPEFIISFIYVGTLVSEPIKAKRIKTIKEQVRQSNRVSLKLLSKVMSMKRQTFIVKFPALMKDLGFKIENGHIIVPPDKTTEFLEGLDKKFKSDDETKTNLKEE
ncbi:MAG: hypothetical protein JW891_13155 [Candidatus Lokiarchaeota archaeon]|nr:hypothetical protein [Candidatus Lokiarchaeota archaeon]